MSGFGLKSPLRRLIVVEDYFFNSAGDFCSKMLEVFAKDVRNRQRLYTGLSLKCDPEDRNRTKDRAKRPGIVRNIY